MAKTVLGNSTPTFKKTSKRISGVDGIVKKVDLRTGKEVSSEPLNAKTVSYKEFTGNDAVKQRERAAKKFTIQSKRRKVKN